MRGKPDRLNPRWPSGMACPWVINALKNRVSSSHMEVTASWLEALASLSARLLPRETSNIKKHWILGPSERAAAAGPAQSLRA